ncbi:LLM class flavin-dependent oxidoreductase [Oenococcus alcoholitolerans]|uniref:Luciferase n=1 Tax=Oenococcus alcoholitolerans TaxID=931074 RepID=A0ABR4XRX6_9LACO|nr:luciferase [Oenococcus alcoholitolerans]
MNKLTFGLDIFGDILLKDNGQLASGARSIRQVVEEGILADQLGIDIIALGEHHRPDYAISSPEMVLAALAEKTDNIKLSSAVTVLSSDDPVRVFERFSILDALSNGRAQVILGRGSFTESFPLFGYDLADYEDLFEEKTALFKQLLAEKPVTWQGKLRPPLKNADVYPKTESGKLETWIGVGGSPESIIRAARYSFPVILAIIGGDPSRFKPYVELYHRAAEELKTKAGDMGVHSHGVIAEDEDTARKIAWRTIRAMLDKIGRERGWAAMSKEQFDHEIKTGSLYVGTPEQVAQKIAKLINDLGIQRFDLVYGAGNQTSAERLNTIELYGSKVIPRVHELLKR